MLCGGNFIFRAFFPYGIDSASYIEQARSFMVRGVFEITPYGTAETGVSIPETLFPPGYSLIIALGSTLLQIPAEVAAPFLSLAALALLPVVMIFCFQRIIGLETALWIGILVALTPAAVRHGYIAFTDTLSLLWVIFSIHLLLMANNKSSSWILLGVLTGYSYLIRNANLALIISMPLFFLWTWIIEPENRKDIFKNTLFWSLGSSLIIVPWLIRNFLVFGKFRPIPWSQVLLD
jgi:Dolichyl-phosphate-mannose-protein mannosyltransferase